MALQGRLCVMAALFPVGCTSVVAQASTPPAAKYSSDQGNTASPSAAAGPDSEELDTVIVTARRRQEELQRTPVSVVSLSSGEIEARSLTNLRDLQNFVPNLTFAPSIGVGDAAGNIFIRGIGQEDFVAGAEAGVGFYIDGVYVARSMGTLIDLLDVDRVEVLRGPQGTLYGKNTIGGAINIISTAPHGAAEGYADAVAGNLGRIEARAMVNSPLTDRLFVRLAAGRFVRDGYLTRLASPFPPSELTETNHDREGSDDSAAVRLQLRWLATPTLTFDIAGDGSRRRATQSVTHVDAIDSHFGVLPAVNALIRGGDLPGPEISGALATEDWLTSYAGGGSSIARDVAGFAASVTKEIGPHKLKLIASHRRLRSHVLADADGTWFQILEADFAERHRQSSAELQASGTIGSVTYSAGLFALGELMRPISGRGVSRVTVLYLCGCFYPPNRLPVAAYTRRRQTGSSIAAYAQASFPLASRLTATLGGRFSREHKATDVQLVQLEPDTLEPTEVVVLSGTNDGRWNSLTWRAGLDFQAAHDLMVYVSAAKGYKSGGFNTRPVVNLPNLGLADFAPETAVTYEAGVRSQWFGRRLRLNMTVFYTDYRDIQLFQQTFIDGVTTTVIQNAARARIRGVEIEAAAKLSGSFTAKLAYGHLEPRYLDIGRVPGLTLDTDFQRTPRDSFTGSLDYALRLGTHELELHGDYSYRSHEQLQLIASEFDQPGYGLLGARLTLRGSHPRWSAALFGTNLLDKRYRVAGRDGLAAVGIANSVIGLPRQVGVEFRAGF